MGARQTILAVAVALLLAGCSSGQTRSVASHAVHPRTKQATHTTPPPEQPTAPSIPSTADAVAPSGPTHGIQSLLSGRIYTMSGYQNPPVGYLPGHGLIVQRWPSGPSPSETTTSGALWLVNPATGSAKNLMDLRHPNNEPVLVYASSHWVLWGQKWDGTGGPITFYLYNVLTGTRQQFTDRFTGTSTAAPNGTVPSSFGTVQGIAFSGDTLYLRGDSFYNNCEQTGVIQHTLTTGSEQPLVVAQNCRRPNSSGPAPSLTRPSGDLPLQLTGESVTAAALSGTTLYIGVTAMAPAAPNMHASTLASLDLTTGKIEDIATSQEPITSVAADSDVVAFSTLHGTYALTHGSRQLVKIAQGAAVSVSGQLVGYGAIYDSTTGTTYARGSLFGTEVTWYAGGKIYYAALDLSKWK